MRLLNGLLGHYQKLFKEKQLNIDLIIDIIKKETQIKLVSNELKLKDGVLFIKTKPKYKLEIILKKTIILKQFKNQGLEILNLK